MRNETKLSVVIPCLNAVETLGAQLEALARQRWSEPWEVVIADNGSTDGTRSLIAQWRDQLPNLHIVDASARRGAAYARNQAVRAAAGDLILFTDADDVVGDGWLAAMGDALLRYDFVACRTDATKLNPPWLSRNPQSKGLQKLSYPPFLPHAGAGTMGISKALFQEVGAFNEALPQLEDTDFCIRAQLLGAELHFVADAVLHLRWRSTARQCFRQAMNWAEFNTILARRYWPADASTLGRWKVWLRDLVRLPRKMPRVLSVRGRYELAFFLGWQTGRLKGVLKHNGVPV